MISKIFTVFDSKAEVYMPPFLFQNKGEAIRAFADSVTAGDSMMAKHPEDFTLFEIGSFDNSTAEIVMFPAKVSLGLALEFVARKEG